MRRSSLIALISAATLTNGAVTAANADDLDARLEALETENVALKKQVRINALEKENAALKMELNIKSSVTETKPLLSKSSSSDKSRSSQKINRPGEVDNVSSSEGIHAISNALAYAPTSRAQVPEKASVANLLVPILPSWGGLYFGFHAGGGIGQWPVTETSQNQSTFFSSFSIPQTQYNSGLTTSATNLNPSGAIGGLQAGYLWTVGPILFGPEIDISSSTIGQRDSQIRTSTSQSNVSPPSAGSYQSQAEASIRWLSSLRGKVGLSVDNWMFFGTAGLAIGYFDLYASAFNLAESKYIIGYSAGGGISYALSPHLALRAEYLYYGFPTTGIIIEQSQSSGSSTYTTSTAVNGDLSSHVIRAGIDWRIN